ncbi:MAG: sigma-70 family RNA polymerase sigma factor [Clostridia bacterium]|nr:sigma-70 family RNA polymerase sigma factor [Clostridia bacterium]
MKDERLISLLRSDPERGMKKVIDLYGGLVSAVIRGRLSGKLFCHADVEDCAAQTFAEFYLGISRADAENCGVKGRLCVIAKRNALDMLRRYYSRPQTAPLDGEAVKDIADPAQPESALVEAEDRAALIAAIRALGRPDSEIILRKYFLGQSSKETAESMGLTVSNVDTRTHRAIKKLQSSLKGE